MAGEDTIGCLEHAAQISMASLGAQYGTATCRGIECKVKRIYPKCGERIAKPHHRFTFKFHGKRITRAQAAEQAAL